MTVAWRSISLILLMVAGFQLATIVQAQPDYSFGRWLDARERMEADAEAAKRGIPVEAALAERRRRLFGRLRVDPTPQQRQADLKQYEKDKAEAIERGISFDVVIAERLASFGRWLDARERMEAEAEAAERGIPVGAILEKNRREAKKKRSEFYVLDEVSLIKQYEKDKAEAVERGISFDVVIAERLAENRARARLAQAKAEKERAEAEAKAEKERAKARKQQAIALAVAAIIVFAVIVIVFKARRRIAATISRRWRRKSKAFRVWAFSSIFWAVGALLYIWLAEPYGSRMSDAEVWHMFGVMIVPPLFLGAVWFGYKRFVDLQVADIRPTDVETRTDDHAKHGGGMGKKIGKIIGKVVLSFLAGMVAIMLGDVIGHYVLGLSPDPKTLSLMFVPALIFPIWYPSQIPKRLMAAFIGPIVGFGFWYISLVLPVESGPGIVLVAGAIRGGAFIVALGAEFLVMRPRARLRC